MNPSASQSEAIVPNYRALKVVVILLGALILLALGGLVAGLLLGIGPKSPAARADIPFRVDLGVGRGGRIVGSQLDGNRLTVHLADDAGETLVILDAASGREVGRVHIAQAP